MEGIKSTTINWASDISKKEINKAQQVLAMAKSREEEMIKAGTHKLVRVLDSIGKPCLKLIKVS